MSIPVYAISHGFECRKARIGLVIRYLIFDFLTCKSKYQNVD
uniref:Uncharacterized protein n=1 Tax=Rhizophora mucronata TaxID=61149 RepID=A0A2P2P450_RHIMU